MPGAILVYAVGVQSLMTSNQGLKTVTTVTSMTTALDNITAHPVQSNPKPQGPSLTAVNVSSTAMNGPTAPPTENKIQGFTKEINNLLPAGATMTTPRIVDSTATSTSMSVTFNDQETTQNVQYQSVQSFPVFFRESSVTPHLTVTNRLNMQASTKKLASLHNSNTSMPPKSMNFQPMLVFATQVDTEALFLGSTATLDSGKSPTNLAVTPSASGTQVFLSFRSSTSLLSQQNVPPLPTRKTPPLMMSGQTLSANSLGSYANNSQTLAPTGAITVSGTKISLAPNESAVFVRSSTEAFGPSVTTSTGSIPSGTEVQKYTGNSHGASHQPWSSSMTLLLVVVVFVFRL